MIKRIFALLLFCCLLLSGCSMDPGTDAADDDQLRIVTSSYPSYDFARAVAGNQVSLHMLTRPGIDPHEYEPTPQNIIDLETCDVFIYNGGESDVWVNHLLDSVENEDMQIIRMMDCVETLMEEFPEDMTQEDEHDHDHNHDAEYDEHVWLSPRNVMGIVEVICEVLSELDPAQAETYTKYTAEYLAELQMLDETFVKITETAARKTLVFADRFPARYFTEAYGLSYYAAFHGCSSHTEPDAATVAQLIDKIREEEIPTIFRVPYSSSTLPESISEETGAAILLFQSFHNVSTQEYGQVTYLDVMYENAEALKRALN